ncbi:transporter [Polynucleobacter paneuropaeus]|nr:transporter [Polynucleobacter paneuropaeus]MBT8617488.1 transporter [Polynucleobacter paneuropaeus]MBT8619370.1 transporter [Polynucleobacter paneuropaeus]MBT8621254.1 transporter [Polynucleobacter paneuropaeus]MBT8626785.1 transporter [Polynucleobacter paneuropaeus]
MTNFHNPLKLLNFYANNIFGGGLDVFMLSAILIFVIHSFLVLLITKGFGHFISRSSISWKARVSFLPYAFVMFLIVLTHMMDLLFYAYMLDGMGVFTDPLASFYFAGEMYTTVGYGNYQLSPEWRGLPLVIAFSGIFAVSISGAGLFNMLQMLLNERNKKK